MDYGRKIQPFRSTKHFQQLADALNGAEEAQGCNVTLGSIPDGTVGNIGAPFFPPLASGSTFFVDANKGSDSNPGTMSSPFQTIPKAVASARSSGNPSTLILREGTFYLTATLQLGAEDSGLTIQNYPNEEVWISGGKAITPRWEAFNTKGANVYKADLSAAGVQSVPGFRVNGKRAIRSRYPNADPELGFGSTLTTKWVPPTLPDKPDTEIYPDEPKRLSSDSFQHYQLGIGGPCKNFDPPAGYWCGSKTEGGGAFTYKIPSGMIADKTVLPNSPYKNTKGAIVQTWRPSHWASWMFEVGNYDATNGTFTFSKGGFQGARGQSSGAEFYIENVMEELDSPNEWFYDEETKTLYFWYNDTVGTPPPSNALYVVTQLKTLIEIQATQEKAAFNISILGVNFRDTAYTYMDPHGMPSGGDWALERMGALFFEGTVNTLVDSCIFERLDGNGIMISGYNRNATIQRNEFAWIGSTAIAAWGYTKGTDIQGMGWDGTDGNQPRFTRILHNFV